MNAFMAVMIGLGNQAISRLHGTWDKLPTKYKKLMNEFEAVLVSIQTRPYIITNVP